MSSVKAKVGLCQGQNEFVVGKNGWARAREQWRDILWRMMNNLKFHQYTTQTTQEEQRIEEEGRRARAKKDW